jgi:hypothetical protein
MPGKSQIRDEKQIPFGMTNQIERTEARGKDEKQIVTVEGGGSGEKESDRRMRAAGRELRYCG